MFENIKRLYTEGKLTDKGLQNAVTKGWITAQELEQIKTTAAEQQK